MRRGDIYWVDLEPSRGAEANKIRPAVIVSNDAANRAVRGGRGVVTVVPITSNTAKVYPFQVLLPARDCGLGSDSKAQAEQVRTVAAARLRARIGGLPPAVLKQLDEALRTHLSL